MLNSLEGNIHLWRFGVGLAEAPCLSAEERARAASFLSDPARLTFLAARTGVRLALARYTGIPAEKLVLAADENGKPHSVDTGVHFNLSHSRDVVVAAFSLSPVGVDIEFSGRRAHCVEIARRYFDASEIAEAEAGPGSFFRLWTSKEAMLKLTGEGLSGGLALAKLARDGRGAVRGREVSISHFEIGGCIGAVASFASLTVKGWFEI